MGPAVTVHLWGWGWGELGGGSALIGVESAGLEFQGFTLFFFFFKATTLIARLIIETFKTKWMLQQLPSWTWVLLLHGIHA